MLEIIALRAVLEPFIAVFGAMIVSGVVVAFATELMKLKWIPLPVQKYPRVSAAIASGIAALVSLYNSSVNFVIDSWVGWLALTFGVLLVSVITYNQLIKGSAANVTSTKPTEGTKL